MIAMFCEGSETAVQFRVFNFTVPNVKYPLQNFINIKNPPAYDETLSRRLISRCSIPDFPHVKN